MKVLELYCGIGGLAAALGALGEPSAEVAAAIDVNTPALAVYRHNFPGHRALARNLDSLPAGELEGFEADLWWLSPPCQPFTRRGAQRDDEDPRAATFLAMIERIGELTPRAVALENVPGFVGSRVHAKLLETLAHARYEVTEHLLCPSDYGLPNRRRRYYLAAVREGHLQPLPERPAGRQTVADLLDAEPEPDLEIPSEIARGYEGALDRVDPADPEAVTACFTSAYGRSWVRSGSYLEQGDGRLRRFSPREILRLLGFPKSFTLPPGLPREVAWRLVGNSLSLPPVRAVLGRVGLPSRRPSTERT